MIRRVDQIKERGFPGTGCCGQYNQNAGGESASKEGAIEEGVQERCRKREREGEQEGRQRAEGGDGYGGTWPDALFGQRSPVLPQTSEPGRGLSTCTSLTKPDTAARAEQKGVRN